MTSKVQVGVIGTSWWADAMFLPALTAHPGAEVVAVCGRDCRARAGLRAALVGAGLLHEH